MCCCRGNSCLYTKCVMNRRFNRRLEFAVKLTALSVAVTLVWLYLSTKSIDVNDKTFSERFVKRKSNETETKILNEIIENSIEELRKRIISLNNEQNVYNWDTFGPLSDSDLVLVIQVHNRVQYLSSLIQSLEKTRDISRTLLIFSHDVFDPQINSLVQSIKFCKVLQIFYPHSLQLNPNTFPGQSPDDCPRDINKEDALKLGCTNAKSPDSYGHYREAVYCQTKHHWWWKCNVVFDTLDITSRHSGAVMFLEEDHFLSPDIIHVWQLMEELNIKNGNNWDVLTLGSYSRSPDFVRNSDKVLSTKWHSSQHNMGFVINRKVWNKIKQCSQPFCSYDDYNWDWSLQYISDHCLSSPLTTLVASAQRVFHVGDCGLHHKKTKCNNKEVIDKIQKLFISSEKYLFPKQLIVKTSDKVLRAPKPNGGWADPRDHRLCLNATNERL